MHSFLLSALALSFLQHTIEFTLDPGEIGFHQSGSMESVLIPGGASPFQQGRPSLPGMTYSVVIPPDAALTGVEVTVLEQISIPGSHLIAPVCAVPIGTPRPAFVPRSSDYTSPVFPEESVPLLNTGSKSGFAIGTFCFVPFIWDPGTGELSVVTKALLTPEVEHVPGRSAVLSEYQVSIAMEAMEELVENPEMLSAYAPPAQPVRGTPWVVVSDEQHQDVLEPLVQHRIETHGAAEFVSTQWICSSYEGRDTQEKIRNYLKDSYENDGLVYALIVGDFGETTRLSSLNISGTVMNAVSDLYYCDLNGSWDSDGDGLYGELTDGVDYFSDIYAGRFSSDVPARLATMVEKTIAYETSAPGGDWRTTALLAGAGLWVDEPPGYWGSFVCDSIDTRIPPSWTVHKLYEDYESHPNNQIELYNQGVSYSSLNGHGNEAGVWWLFPPSTELVTTGNYVDLENQGMLTVFHSMACHPGHLQNIGCIAERLMFAPWGGAIAVMFNSHWGIGCPPSFGPSEWLELFFAETLIQDQQYELGVAHGLSKDAFKAGVSISHQNWILQENNFLGDPATRFAAGQTGIHHEGGSGASGPILLPPSPNPCSGSLWAHCVIPHSGYVELRIYDLAGREAADPLHQGSQEGDFTVSADMSSLPAGCYHLVLCAGEEIDSRTVVILP